MALAQVPGTGSSWLAKQCGPLSRCCSLSCNTQIIPALKCSTFTIPPLPKQPTQHHNKGQQLVACAAAFSPTTAVEFVDATQARLYMLYEFVSQHQRLPRFHEQHNSVAVGHWSEQCRLLHHDAKLEPELVAALESIPQWNWRVHSRTMASELEEATALLQQYCERHQRMPRLRNNSKSVATGEDKAATAVVLRMYDLRKRGLLTSQQIEHMTSSLPGWKWDSRVRAPPLDKLIQLLQEFAEQHGRLPKQHEKLPDGFLLGEWCSLRRSEYNKGDLPIDVADAIAAGVPGWAWNLLDSAFEDGLEVLKRFVAVHHRMPTQREEFEGVRLGAWVNKRRLQYKQGIMPLDRVAALEAVEGWWWTAEDMPVE